MDVLVNHIYNSYKNKYTTIVKMSPKIKTLQKASYILYTIIFLIMFVIISGIGVYHLEKDIEGANITNLHDALWWAVVSISTVGYGDFTPVSDGGRVIGVLVMLIGVLLFGTFTALIATSIVRRQEWSEKLRDEEILQEIKLLKLQIKETDKLVSEIIKEEDKIAKIIKKTK